jgi:hypothetical protein
MFKLSSQSAATDEIILLPGGPWPVRNNCQDAGSWRFGRDQVIGTSIEMVILAYDTGVGFVPPLKKEDQIIKALNQSQYQTPAGSKISAKSSPQDIMEGVVSRLLSEWGIVLFVPTPACTASLSPDVAQYLPRKTICSTFIKSRGLDKRETGFYGTAGLIDRVAANRLKLSEVIVEVHFEPTHKNAASGADVAGLVWNYRLPETDEEVAFIKEVDDWMGTNADKLGSTVVEGADQFMSVDLRNYQAVVETKRIISEGVGMTALEAGSAINYKALPYDREAFSQIEDVEVIDVAAA